MDQIEKLIYVNSAARMLACTPKHIYEMIKAEEIKGVRVGVRGVRVIKQSVIDFIEKNTINPDDYYA